MTANASSAYNFSGARTASEVPDVLLTLENTIVRATKALARAQAAGADTAAARALSVLIEELTAAHNRLLQDTYYAGASIQA